MGLMLLSKAYVWLSLLWDSSASAAVTKKMDHTHIFVGGSHFSGADTVENILSSQYLASGFRTEWSVVESTGIGLIHLISAYFKPLYSLLCLCRELRDAFSIQRLTQYVPRAWKWRHFPDQGLLELLPQARFHNEALHAWIPNLLCRTQASRRAWHRALCIGVSVQAASDWQETM